MDIIGFAIGMFIFVGGRSGTQRPGVNFLKQVGVWDEFSADEKIEAIKGAGIAMEEVYSQYHKILESMKIKNNEKVQF